MAPPSLSISKGYPQAHEACAAACTTEVLASCVPPYTDPLQSIDQKKVEEACKRGCERPEIYGGDFVHGGAAGKKVAQSLLAGNPSSTPDHFIPFGCGRFVRSASVASAPLKAGQPKKVETTQRSVEQELEAAFPGIQLPLPETLTAYLLELARRGEAGKKGVDHFDPLVTSAGDSRAYSAFWEGKSYVIYDPERILQDRAPDWMRSAAIQVLGWMGVQIPQLPAAAASSVRIPTGARLPSVAGARMMLLGRIPIPAL